MNYYIVPFFLGSFRLFGAIWTLKKGKEVGKKEYIVCQDGLYTREKERRDDSLEKEMSTEEGFWLQRFVNLAN